jgi:hypothetical protein
MVSRNSLKDRDPAFSRAITDLLKRYQINVSPTEADDQDVFILSVGDLDIHLIGSPRGYLSIACKAGRIPDEGGNEACVSLLEANLFKLEHPVLSVGVASKTREVLLSTRQPLSELDSTGAFRLVESVIEHVQTLGEWLKAPRYSRPTPSARRHPSLRPHPSVTL